MDDDAKFRAEIKRLRRVAGLTQVELADRMGLHQGTVSEWEIGRARPNWENIIKAEEALHLGAGTLGSMLGYTAPGVSVTEAIHQDPRLSTETKKMLVGLYEKLLDT